MSAAQKIYHLTGMRPAEVRDWAHVYWVRFEGQRPTMYSKKIVDRAAEIEARNLGGDKAARDLRSGKIYVLRANWSMGYTIKEVTPGQGISNYSDFSLVRGVNVADVGYTARPKRVSEIIACVAANLA